MIWVINREPKVIYHQRYRLSSSAILSRSSPCLHVSQRSQKQFLAAFSPFHVQCQNADRRVHLARATRREENCVKIMKIDWNWNFVPLRMFSPIFMSLFCLEWSPFPKELFVKNISANDKATSILFISNRGIHSVRQYKSNLGAQTQYQTHFNPRDRKNVSNGRKINKRLMKIFHSRGNENKHKSENYSWEKSCDHETKTTFGDWDFHLNMLTNLNFSSNEWLILSRICIAIRWANRDEKNS